MPTANNYIVAGFPANGTSLIGCNVSVDLVTWATPALSIAAGGANAFYNVPWISDDATLWLLLGNGLQASTDGGNTWTEGVLSTATDGPNLGQGKGVSAAMDPVSRRAVAVGGWLPTPHDGFQGVIYYADPPYTTWTKVRVDTRAYDNNVGDPIWAVAAIPGVGFVISGTGVLLFSADGTSWGSPTTFVSGPTYAKFQELNWNGAYMLAWGLWPDIAKSSNGTTWTSASPGITYENFLTTRTLKWDTTRALWIVLGYFSVPIVDHSPNNLFYHVISTSPDGVTWTQRFLSTTGTTV